MWVATPIRCREDPFAGPLGRLRSLLTNAVIIRFVYQEINVSILIAEDNEAQRKYLGDLLSDKFPGYMPLIETNDGESAVRLAIEGRPALSIFDIQMPNLSGVKAAK